MDASYYISPEMFVKWLQDEVKNHTVYADAARVSDDMERIAYNRAALDVYSKVLAKYAYVMPPPAMPN